jgi:hypothetical protein
VRVSAALAAGLLIAAHGVASEPPATRVAVEVFTVAVADDGQSGLEFERAEGPLEQGLNPDDRARELASPATSGLLLIHSTSWRWEPDGRIVLTYLAWAAVGSLGPDARKMPDLSPPGPTDPLHPRPAEIAELDPLAHGLRHLAFLVRTDSEGTVAEALGPSACAILLALEPGTAGQLP